MPALRGSRPRIVDVARHAGVSAQTVSNVINGRKGFTEETRLRVETSIEALGFAPNRHAQSLRSRRTGLIGFDATSGQLDVTTPFTVGLLRALVRTVDHHGLGLLVFAHERQQAEDFRRRAAAGLVDGFILSDSTAGDFRPGILQDLGIPFVVFGRPDTPGVISLEIDNAAAMAQAVDHVVAQGCRDVAYIAYGGTEHWHRERRRGVRAALRRHGLALPRHRIMTGTSLSSIQARLPDYLTAHGTPDAVVTTTDPIAVSVVGAAAGLGLHVGVDLAVTGFDDSPLTGMVVPPITSVAIPVDESAQLLLNMLLDALAGEAAPGERILETRLSIRESSGFGPRPGDREAAS